MEENNVFECVSCEEDACEQTCCREEAENREKEQKKNENTGIATFVLGLLSCLGIAPIPCGIVAIILGSMSVKKSGDPFAKTGMILGIVSVAMQIISLITVVLVLMVYFFVLFMAIMASTGMYY